MKVEHWDKKSNITKELQKFRALDINFSIDLNNDELFFIYNEEKLCGYATINLEKNAKLKKIFVIPKYRNNGYGTFLLKYIINWITKEKCDSLTVTNHKKMNNFLEKQKFLRTEDGYILDKLLEIQKQKKNMVFVAKVAIIINIILAFLKIFSGKIFNSMSLLADGLNSFSDLITNILVIIGLKVGSNPEDKEHPFGHGKIESVFSIIIGTFIMLSAVQLIRENIEKVFSKNGENVKLSNILITISIISILIKVFQLIFMKNKTKSYRGALINSLLQDYKNDIIISISVLIGLLCSKINPVFDTIIGLIVAIYILKSGYELIRDNSLILMDSQNEELLSKIRDEILEFEEIENAHDFKMTTSGKDIHIFLDARMKKDKTIEEAHEIINTISKKIKYQHPNIKSLFVHIEPMYEND